MSYGGKVPLDTLYFYFAMSSTVLYLPQSSAQSQDAKDQARGEEERLHDLSADRLKERDCETANLCGIDDQLDLVQPRR